MISRRHHDAACVCRRRHDTTARISKRYCVSPPRPVKIANLIAGKWLPGCKQGVNMRVCDCGRGEKVVNCIEFGGSSLAGRGAPAAMSVHGRYSRP
ncbi:hypothetical protein KCP75_21790 [Salmonella enterica subsp. enterica]|nr:hypothetical protein KCP75_21790 [Salmonella enterica subsp. enterica]